MVKQIILKTRVTITQKQLLLISLRHLTVIYVLEAVYIYYIWMLETLPDVCCWFSS